VSNDDDRLARFVHLDELSQHSVSVGTVEGPSRFVGEHQLARLEQQPGDGDTLLLPARELEDLVPRDLRQAHSLQHFCSRSPLVFPLPRHVLLGHAEVVVHRLVVNEGVILEQVRKAAAAKACSTRRSRGRSRLTEQAHTASIGCFEQGHDVEQGRLARPGWARHRYHLAGANNQVDTSKYRPAPITLRHTLQLADRYHP
jgi:hypothetical protein